MTFMLLFTLLSLLFIVGGCVRVSMVGARHRGEPQDILAGNGLGCGLVLWGLVMFWGWLVFVVGGWLGWW